MRHLVETVERLNGQQRMITGIRESFAIEAEPRAFEGEWSGGVRFWIGNCEVGDWQDAAALQLICGWLRKFTRQQPDCVDGVLADGPPRDVFDLVVDTVVDQERGRSRASPVAKRR